MRRKKMYPMGTTVVVKSLPEGRDLPAELLGAEAIVVKLLTDGTTHMHTIDTVRAVKSKRRWVLIPGTCLASVKPEEKKTKRPLPPLRISNNEMAEIADISEELKAWPISGMSQQNSMFNRIWNRRVKLHARRAELMQKLPER